MNQSKLSTLAFLEGIKEKKIPIIKLSRSRNGETGTATFLFLEPTLFDFQTIYFFEKVESLTLYWNNEMLISDNVSILFQKTRPFGIKVLFLVKQKKEWVFFFNFLRFYIREISF